MNSNNYLASVLKIALTSYGIGLSNSDRFIRMAECLASGDAIVLVNDREAIELEKIVSETRSDIFDEVFYVVCPPVFNSLDSALFHIVYKGSKFKRLVFSYSWISEYYRNSLDDMEHKLSTLAKVHIAKDREVAWDHNPLVFGW